MKYTQEDVNRIESTFNQEQSDYLNFLFSYRQKGANIQIGILMIIFITYVIYTQLNQY